jgi:hypothetical protein
LKLPASKSSHSLRSAFRPDLAKMSQPLGYAPVRPNLFGRCRYDLSQRKGESIAD